MPNDPTLDAVFLAAIPSLAWIRASNSLVCVFHAGRKLVDVIELELPTRRRQADYRDTADSVIGLARRGTGIDQAVTVVYTDRSFEADRGIPLSEFAAFLNSRIHRSGLHLPGSFCVASDGWGDYFDLRRPRRRRSLDELNRRADG